MLFLCIALAVIFSAVSYLFYKINNKDENTLKKLLCVGIAAFIFALGLEISIFNVNYYISHSYTPQDLSHYISEAKNENNEYIVYSDTDIEFSEINTKINNIKIELSQDSPNRVDATVYLTDEANKYYFSTPARTIYNGVDNSEFINVSTAGNSEHLRINLKSNNDFIKIKSISINEKRDFDISVLRIAVLFCVICAIYVFKPSSPIYKMKLSKNKENKTNLLIGFMAIECVIFIIFGTLNPAFLGIQKTTDGYKLTQLQMENHNQYDELAQAILSGKTYIDNDDVPQSLINMDNPYDTTSRAQTATLTGDTYRWDVSFFNGHYYVYFGIVPLLIMYLPFRAFFNAPFPSAIGIIAFASLFALGVFKLLGFLCEKYFKNVSLGVYLLTSLSFINCCGAMFLVKRPDFYSIPIITAMSFVIWGIYFWLKGKNSKKNQSVYYTLGSFCCALAVGCRPQSVLMCAVALPLFWEYFFKDKMLFKKEGIKNIIALGVPFIIVASGVMYYNFIRFGSPFDFGSGYNLTTNDVTKRGFDIGRTGLGLFTYLFQPPSFTAVFPYLKKVDINTAYIGKTIAENCFGGLFAVTPVLWFTAFLPKVKDELKKNRLYMFTLTSLLIGFATVIADTQAGGLLQRYFSDFGYIFFISLSVIIFALFNKNQDAQSNKFLSTLLFISTIFSLLYTLCLVFSVSDVTIDIQNSTAFGTVKYLVEFWL